MDDKLNIGRINLDNDDVDEVKLKSIKNLEVYDEELDDVDT